MIVVVLLVLFLLLLLLLPWLVIVCVRVLFVLLPLGSAFVANETN